MSEGRERGLFFVSFFLKKKIEGASCFGSFLKRTFRGVVIAIFIKLCKHLFYYGK